MKIHPPQTVRWSCRIRYMFFHLLRLITQSILRDPGSILHVIMRFFCFELGLMWRAHHDRDSTLDYHGCESSTVQLNYPAISIAWLLVAMVFIAVFLFSWAAAWLRLLIHGNSHAASQAETSRVIIQDPWSILSCPSSTYRDSDIVIGWPMARVLGSRSKGLHHI